MPFRAALAMMILKAIDATANDNLKSNQFQIEYRMKCGTVVVVTINADRKKKKTNIKLVKPGPS